jgi:TolB protein
MRIFALCFLLPLVLMGCVADETPIATPIASPTAQVTPTITPTSMVIPPTPTPTPLPTGAIVASVYRNNHWDLYILNTQGQLQKRLTFGNGDSRAPAWSPDGTRVAFESRRNNNWDVFVLNLDGTQTQQLTNSPRFDGSPRWSPDGSRLAFVSDRAGNLDVWVTAVGGSDGSNPINLTANSAAPDYDPTWSPDGKQIAFTSLRDDSKEIYMMNSDGSNPRNLTQSKTLDEEQPAWSPDGKHIAFVTEARGQGPREIYVLDAANPAHRQRVTTLQYHQSPVWSPDSASLLFVAQSEEKQPLELVRLDTAYARPFTRDRWRYRQPDWNAHALPTLDESSLQRNDEPLYVEKTTPNPPSSPDRYNLVKLANMNMKTPDYLSDTVDDSFKAMRQRVLHETGWDFLGSLSEAARPLDLKTDESDFLSWHKAGRAIDTLWDYYLPEGRMLEVAREDLLGKTYWRLYLRAAKQDGSQGEPLRELLWDVSAPTRQRVYPRGGIVRGVLPGYYVDLTELMWQYGWRRIPSLPNWQRDFYALEYWHYQKEDGLTWWDAIHEIYTPPEIERLFTYEKLLRARYSVLTMIEKGVPVPSEALQRYQALEP